MTRCFFFAGVVRLLIVPCAIQAKPVARVLEISEVDVEVDAVGGIELPQKAQTDTIWIANWSFDEAGACTDAGWEKLDNHIKNDASLYWSVGPDFDGTGGIVGQAALLGYTGDVCCVETGGYDNGWYQAIRIEYTGNATLSLDYLVDSEPGFDFVQIETDSACGSFERVDLYERPLRNAAAYRALEFSASGLDLSGAVTSLALSDHGPGSHCVYISFFADLGFSPCDGLQSSQIGRALVVDNIVIEDASGTRNEDFSDGTLDVGTFENIQDVTPFGEWGRLFWNITDNDLCVDNRTCAWLWTDHTTPTLANDASMGFGPGGFVIRNWMDNVIVSPWVSLSSTPGANGTVIQFRRFPGNFFATSRMVMNWSVRGKARVQGQECISDWGHAFQFNSLSFFEWITLTFDMTTNFDPGSEAIQVRHRVTDTRVRYATLPDPVPFIPGPGPYMDDTRIGRIVHSGPVIDPGTDARSQAQDAFATEIHPAIHPGAGEHFRPTTDRFGTVAFSAGKDLGIHHSSPNVITGDSIWIGVVDARDAGGVTSVELYGAIVSGPHVGKAPPPWVVGANGFFAVPAEMVRNPSGVIVDDFWFVDLDDFYSRGGDVLEYFWRAGDALGGVSSMPGGLTALPVSIEAARMAAGGLLEVSALPAVAWDPAYLARIAADPHGKLDPTAAELAGSAQQNCILYVNHVNARRQSGDANRTSFMYTLDQLGYRGAYDVYDHTGMGNTNNHLGGRATIEQAQGYSLIVYDAGNRAPGWITPDGSDLDNQKIDQATWFRSWLVQSPRPEVDAVTLWIVGSNALEEKRTNPLFTVDLGVALDQENQGILTPAVVGETSFTFDNGTGTTTRDFTVGPRAQFTANGGCPTIGSYDGLGTSGAGLRVYRYEDAFAGSETGGAVVMNSSASEHWNTILQSHAWADIGPAFGNVPSAPTPRADLLQTILGAVLPPACQEGPDPTDTRETPSAKPTRAQLHANVPNPFNPMTTIRFDTARAGRVRLGIHAISGRAVRTLVDAWLEPGFGHRVIWDGRDADGRPAASGVYLCRLQTADGTQTRKMLLVQ